MANVELLRYSKSEGSTVETRRVLTRAVLWLVTRYQYLAAARLPVCRYVPSCSNYALEALEGHGVVRGSWLSVCRLARCNPWGGRGWDPVPAPAVAPQSEKVSRCST